MLLKPYATLCHLLELLPFAQFLLRHPCFHFNSKWQGNSMDLLLHSNSIIYNERHRYMKASDTSLVVYTSLVKFGDQLAQHNLTCSVTVRDRIPEVSITNIAWWSPSPTHKLYSSRSTYPCSKYSRRASPHRRAQPDSWTPRGSHQSPGSAAQLSFLPSNICGDMGKNMMSALPNDTCHKAHLTLGNQSEKTILVVNVALICSRALHMPNL